MPAASDPGFLVLHALRIKGFAGAPVVSALTTLSEDDVNAQLDKAAGAGFATQREGRISGWALTSQGRAEHVRLITAELDDAGVRQSIDAAYRRFHEINNDLLTVCTDWQLREGALNDHEDAAYDDAVVDRLVQVNAKVQPICGDLGAALVRMTAYGTRFAVALERIEAGDRDWFAKPMIDSYHTVWFELHEDLLVTLGIERSKESSQ